MNFNLYLSWFSIWLTFGFVDILSPPLHFVVFNFAAKCVITSGLFRYLIFWSPSSRRSINFFDVCTHCYSILSIFLPPFNNPKLQLINFVHGHNIISSLNIFFTSFYSINSFHRFFIDFSFCWLYATYSNLHFNVDNFSPISV